MLLATIKKIHIEALTPPDITVPVRHNTKDYKEYYNSSVGDSNCNVVTPNVTNPMMSIRVVDKILLVTT